MTPEAFAALVDAEWERSTALVIERQAATAPLPTLDDLVAIALDRSRSDFIGDTPKDSTALRIALYCGESAVLIAEQWEDEHPAGGRVPLCLIHQLSNRLHSEAWELIYAEWAERDAEDAG